MKCCGNRLKPYRLIPSVLISYCDINIVTIYYSMPSMICGRFDTLLMLFSSCLLVIDYVEEVFQVSD